MSQSEGRRQPITAEEFRSRMVFLCTRTGAPGLPRKNRDRHILFRAALQRLPALGPMSAARLNDALESWLTAVGLDACIDHVSLRRYLVDAGYLVRDSAGTEYHARVSGRGEVLFGAGVESLDAVEIIRSAHEDAALRKRTWDGAGDSI